MAAWDRPYDRSDTLDFIADMLRRYRTDGIGYVAAFEKQTDELVALCGLLAEQRRHVRVVEIPQERIDVRDQLARECAEDEPAYPALVLGKAQLVSNPPQHDARKDAFFQHAELHEPTD